MSNSTDHFLLVIFVLASIAGIYAVFSNLKHKLWQQFIFAFILAIELLAFATFLIRRHMPRASLAILDGIMASYYCSCGGMVCAAGQFCSNGHCAWDPVTTERIRYDGGTICKETSCFNGTCRTQICEDEGGGKEWCHPEVK